MKELLNIFNYIQKFYKDNFDALFVVLEFLLVAKNTKLSDDLLTTKEKAIPHTFYTYLESLELQNVAEINPHLNFRKVLKSVRDLSLNAEDLEYFLQTIALQKTILKLYSYATPVEINALIRGLLALKAGESVYNPCFGLGTWLLSVRAFNKDCAFCGVDINPKLVGITKALALLLEFKACKLEVGDIFQQPFIPNKQYDKVFCHPPILSHLSLQAPKESKLAPYTKTALEIPFIEFALLRFKKKAVFILRTSLLSKGAGERLCAYLLEMGYLESVIELPDNIFPYQTDSFCLLILSKNNKRGFFIDVRKFYLKEGKYQKLINIEEILDLYASKQNTQYSLLLDYANIAPNNLKPSFYLESFQKKEQVELESLLESCYCGARVVSKSDKDLVGCYDFGIKDFSAYGFSDSFSEFVFKANCAQLTQLKIKPYDVLLSMRGVIPKVAIIGESARNKAIIPNAGILVLRFKDSVIAKVLYIFFLSKSGQEFLRKIYSDNNERVNEKTMKAIQLPKHILDAMFIQQSTEKFNKLNTHGIEIAKHIQSIKSLLEF